MTDRDEFVDPQSVGSALRHPMQNVIRILSITYALTLCVASAWAWCIAVEYQNSSVEHLAPAILLSLVTLPSSLTFGPLFDARPSLFSTEFRQLTWLTVCGVFQLGLLILLGGLVRKPKGES